MRDYHGEARSLCERAGKAKKATAEIEDRLETVFFWCKLLDQLTGAGSVAFGKFLEWLFQDILRGLSKWLSEH